MKKINISDKTKKIVTAMASVGGAVTIVGLAYVIGFRAGGKDCAEIINDALNYHGDEFNVHYQDCDVTRVSYKYGLTKQKLCLYRSSGD